MTRELTAPEKVSLSLTGKFGDKSRRWLGESAGYVAKHAWIVKHYGKASKCSFDATHTAKRYEWANVSGQYMRDITDYLELCPSCHRKNDSNTHCKHGHLYTAENTYINPRGHRQCRECGRKSRKRCDERAGN